MDMARVIGTLWCSVKDPALDNLRLAIVQPVNHRLENMGEPAVAIDQLNRQAGELVYIVRSGDAMFAHHGTHYVPTDCAIAGIVDSLNVEGIEEGQP